MSADERILRALEIDARIPTYDEAAPVLAAIVSRTRRRRVARRALVAVAAAVAALAISVAAPAILDRAASGRGVPLSTGSALPPSTPAEIGFTYRSGSPTGEPSRFGIEGPLWLTLGADGTGLLRGPRIGASSFGYTVTGFSIAVDLWSDSRCSGDPDGQYALGGRQGQLLLSLIRDPCGPRRSALLGGPGAHPWHQVGS